MKLEESQLHCQIPSLKQVAEGIEKEPKQSIIRSLKLMIRRRLSPTKERALKNFTNDLMDRGYGLAGRAPKGRAPQAANSSPQLQAGDLIRVRSLQEIEATLNHWRQLRGCAFMPDMAEYCGTTQRVLKPMNRFVDERDLRVKKAKGIILLEGVMCHGADGFGSCDRSCFFFWREEWLEKIGQR
jgi:hypothetical protein